MSTPRKLFLLALILRLVPVLFSMDLPIGLDDMFQYDMLARSMAAGDGYRWYAQEDLDLLRIYFDQDFVIQDYDPRGLLSSHRGPGYPAFLAIVYKLSGLEWRLLAARLAQAFVGATLAPLTYYLGRRLFPERASAARFGGLAMAVYPMLLVYPLALASENLFIPLVAAGLLALLYAAEKGDDRLYVVAGLLFGLATLTRSIIFGSVGLAALWLWFAVRSRRGALLFGLAVVLMVLPWTIRNSLLHGRLTFVESSLGYNLYLGYHPQGDGSFQYGISLELLPYLDDGQRNQIGLQAGLDFIQQDPGRVPQLMLNKLGYFFALERRAITYFYSNNFFGYIPNIVLIPLFLVFALPWAVISALAAAGLPFLRMTKGRALGLLLIAGYLLPHVLILAEPRFHLALAPAVALLAGWAWASRDRLWTRARAQPGRGLLALALMGLLCLNWGLELWRDADKLAVLFGPEGNRSYFTY